jgi:hypothetical protein
MQALDLLQSLHFPEVPAGLQNHKRIEKSLNLNVKGFFIVSLLHEACFIPGIIFSDVFFNTSTTALFKNKGISPYSIKTRTIL